MNDAAVDWLIRGALVDDIDALVDLCGEHARFERSTYEATGKAANLRQALFGDTRRLRAWVAVARGDIAGYATASVEYATWAAADYLHLDCLYVRSGNRNSGIGAGLFEAVIRFARDCGYDELQWQTPDWNAGAQRFYRRFGASDQRKVRFRLVTSRSCELPDTPIRPGQHHVPR